MANKMKKFTKATVTASIATGIVFIGPQVSDAALGDQPLKPGMRHQDVKELQDLLKQKGFFNFHTSTGFYGDITKDAVTQFQQANKLKQTGEVDSKTLEALVGKKVSQSSTLKVGSRGQAVSEVQTLLQELNLFNHHTITGYYGEITAEGVRNFQNEAGIKVTGKADVKTVEALRAAVKQKNAPKKKEKVTQSTSTLKIGSRGKEVSEVQELLKELDLFNHHTITGYYGEITAEGVRKFQRQSGIKVNGQADSNTIQLLKDAVKANKDIKSTPKQEKPAATFTLKVGERGDAVSELQNQLKMLGYFNHSITGYFGPITESAVKQFQKDHNLISDGLVTTSTIEKLGQVIETKKNTGHRVTF